MKTAILYALVAQATDPAQKQLKELEDFCRKRNIEIIGSYCDTDSGATFDREAFQQMLEAIKSGTQKADVILVTQWDRFSRNLAGALDMIKILRTLGIKVKSLQDFGSNDFEIILKHAQPKQK